MFTPKDEYIILGVIYRSPNCTTYESKFLSEKLDSVVKSFLNKGDSIIICGDFNHPEIDWNSQTCSTREDHIAHIFLNTIQGNFLEQLIKEPTHHRSTQNPTLIDLIITNESDLVKIVDHHPPFGKSHHSVILFTFESKSQLT